MKTRLFIIVGAVMAFMSCSQSEDLIMPEDSAAFASKVVLEPNASGVTVQWNNELQVIDGFGIAQAGHSDKLYAHHKRDEIMGWLFGDEGLRLSILRGQVFPFFSESAGNYDYGFDRDLDVPFTDPVFDGFGNNMPLDKENELLKRAQLWIMREARDKYAVDKMMFSVWSPPAYMKSNGSVIKGHLKWGQYQNYANYLANFVKSFENNGYPIYALSPANEPEYAAEWTSCLWLPASVTLGRFITSNLGPTFEKQGIQTNIVFGENGQWTGILGFIMGSENYVQTILTLNPKVTNYNVIAAGHGYVDPLTKEKTAITPFSKAMDKGVRVWLTEISSVGSYRYDMEDGLDWAADFHRYLSDASASAILYWLGAVPGNDDEGLIFMNMSNREEYSFSKRYETFGNFTRYIKPDSRRVYIDRGEGLPDDLHISSYKKDNELVIVVVNKTEEHVVTPLNLNGADNVSGLKRVLTDADKRWETSDVEPVGDQYMLDVPAKSVVTFTAKVQ